MEFEEPNYFQLTLKQTRILLIKNWRIAYRKRVTTAIQLTVPFFFVLGLYLIQLAVDDALSTNDLFADTPSSFNNPISLIPKCIPHPSSGSHCFTFIYAPDDDIIQEFVSGVLQDNPHLGQHDVKAFPNPQAVNNFILANKNKTQAAYIFNSFTNGIINYDIQYNTSCANSWNGNGQCPPPIDSVIAPMQVSMDKQIMKLSNHKSSSHTPPSFIPNSISIEWSSGLLAHPKTKYYNIVSDLGSIFFFASLMFQFVLMLQDMVVEKETKLKEGMRMMGLKELAYYLSWFLTYSVFIILNVFLLIASGFIFQFTFFKRNDFGTYFFLFLLFGMSIICFGFFLSACLRKSQAATFIGFFLFILFSILQAFIPNLLYIDGKPYSIQAIFSLLSPIVFAKGLTDLATASNFAGLRWSGIADHTHVFPLLLVYRWMVLDSFIFLVLGWYIDNVFPGEFGTPKPFFFFLQPSYWTGRPSRLDFKSTTPSQSSQILNHSNLDEDVINEELKVKEIDPKNSNEFAVVIKDLVKIYRNNAFFRSKKDFHAVKGLSLTMQKNQLFAVLGPNGAGKTTTFSMLTGLFGPTHGDAYIYGHSISDEMNTIRKFMGVCPQHDLLFSHLTGREHLELYSAFKNIPVHRIDQEVEERLKEVGLLEIGDRFTTVYSGGEKRRLSVAIAMTGDPKIVFLDEPCTAMDPIGRRQVWNIIEKMKKNRAIVLTTHSMEEADILSDKIGIMALGRLRCLGDNLHLKSKYGSGYKVTVYLKSQGPSSYNNLALAKSIQAKIVNFVLQSVQGATVLASSTEHVTFSIPRDKTNELPAFLETLENNQTLLNIEDIDVNISSLEEVFLKIVEDTTNESKQPITQDKKSAASWKGCSGTFWLNVLLTILGYIPGVIHAIFVVLD
ncbi:hypothetical protein DFA_03400 [Cavenderia fasciculata]|uniref:ABC transporter domain-containing protein n=1 Tax=Cavenderia fasciculata TaxID=261658 RepID=F4PHG8_CACFS|nr:uncharacterized protein DFA_03400 [Cavenderia fasciculata]EGG25152.1 hypothetical protein DFA_03400 [Cavenderia fasciculata]|eukprot:XP_004363003.1 hypothetical protein DFA_03400 [Cavenderia fasciculata]